MKPIIVSLVMCLWALATMAQLSVVKTGSVSNVGIVTKTPKAALDLGKANYYAGAPLFLIYNDDYTSTLGGTKVGFYADNFGKNNLNLVFAEAANPQGLFTICGKNTSNTTLNPYFSIAGMTGNVGIGTTTPQTKLDVEGDVFIPYSQSFWLGSTSTTSNHLRLWHTGTSGDAYMDYVPNLHFRSNTTEVMYLSSNGNVGIGTSTPLAPLQVNGDVYIPYGQSYRLGSATDANNRLRLYHSGTSGDAYIDYSPNLHLRAGTTDAMYLDNQGNIGINTTSVGLKSTYGTGTFTKVNVNCGGTYIPLNSGWVYSIFSNLTLASGLSNVGIQGNVYTTTSGVMGTDGRAYGVYGAAGNATTGYNYGVYGILTGSYNGAGVFGTTSGAGDYDIDGVYAGFFNGTTRITGDTKIDGALYVNGMQVTSDKNAKKNIVNFDKGNVSKLNQLQGVSFKYKTPQEMSNNAKQTAQADTGKTTTVTIDTAYYNKVRFGVIAQDVQKVYPELVQTDRNGILTVNYIEFIPILIEAVKEQSSKIDSLKSKTSSIDSLKEQIKTLTNQMAALQNCCKSNSKTKDYVESDAQTTSYTNTSATQQIMLYQNAPNPFKVVTTITMYIPQNVGTAMICIYDLNGRQLECLPVDGRGTTSVEVSGSMLTPGMYYYSLLADRNLVDTKKMILTE